MDANSSKLDQLNSRPYDADPFSWAMLALAALSAAAGVAGIAGYRASKKEVSAANRRRLREKIMHMIDLVGRLEREIEFFVHLFGAGDLGKAVQIRPGIELFAPLSTALDFRRTYAAIAHIVVEIEDQKTIIIAELMGPPWNFQLADYLEYKSEELIDSLKKLRTQQDLRGFGEVAHRYMALLNSILSHQIERIA
jgi:ribosomal protein S9